MLVYFDINKIFRGFADPKKMQVILSKVKLKIVSRKIIYKA